MGTGNPFLRRDDPQLLMLIDIYFSSLPLRYKQVGLMQVMTELFEAVSPAFGTLLFGSGTRPGTIRIILVVMYSFRLHGSEILL